MCAITLLAYILKWVYIYIYVMCVQAHRKS